MVVGKHRNCVVEIILVLVLGFISIGSESVIFDVQSGRSKCVAEDIKENAMTVGNFKVINPKQGELIPDSHKITLRVTSIQGHNYHYADRVEAGQFAFQATETGDYMACFYAAYNKNPITISVEFDWKSGVAAKDWSNVAKKDSVDVMQIELEKLYETVTSIHEEMYYLREREQEMQELNLSTNSKMGFLTLLSLVVCLSVAGLQLWHLKTFFEKKKII